MYVFFVHLGKSQSSFTQGGTESVSNSSGRKTPSGSDITQVRPFTLQSEDEDEVGSFTTSDAGDAAAALKDLEEEDLTEEEEELNITGSHREGGATRKAGYVIIDSVINI